MLLDCFVIVVAFDSESTILIFSSCSIPSDFLNPLARKLPKLFFFAPPISTVIPKAALFISTIQVVISFFEGVLKIIYSFPDLN